MPSTLIRKIDYDPGRRCLSVWFVPSGRRYDYRGVPPETYDDFKRAFSKGSFFNRAIRDRFPFSVDEAPENGAADGDLFGPPRHSGRMGSGD